MSKRFKSGAVACLTVGYAILLLARPQAAAGGFRAGILLCVNSVLPALFPFFIVSALLLSLPECRAISRPLLPLTRAWGISSPSAPLLLLMSWLGGYAVCARLTGDQLERGQLTSDQAQRLLILGCCSGPGFVVGCVGGLMLGSVQIGVLLYGLQLAANLLCAALLLLPGRRGKRPAGQAVFAHRPAEQTAADIRPVTLPQAVGTAVDSCLAVCGCVLFARITLALLESLLPLHPQQVAYLRGALEVTAGCDAFAALGGRVALWGCGFCLSVLGLSVFVQVRQLAGAKMPMGRFLLSRVMHLPALQGLLRLCSPFLSGELSVYSSLRQRVIVTNRLPPDAAVVLLLFLAAVLYKTGRKFYNIFVS